MDIAAEDVNIIIAKHLQETGFQHTAYIFRYEALVEDDEIDVPAQSLINIVKKGMLYMQLEKKINILAKDEDDPEVIINNITSSAKNSASTPIKNPKGRPPSSVNAQNVSRSVSAPPLFASPIVLKRHTNEVFAGAWSPDGKKFASASADATSIIWDIGEKGSCNAFVLDHSTKQDRREQAVISISWNSSGTLLATGSNDGSVRLWTSQGGFKHSFVRHTSDVFAVHFSPNDEYLLSCSNDTSVYLWNIKTCEYNAFQNHTDSALDVDWYDNTRFASCSRDKTICIWKIDDHKPLHVLKGHEKDVIKVLWDPSKKYLASCSDDSNIMIWFPFEKTQPYTLEGHTETVYTIKWVPGNNSRKLLVSGGFDKTVKVWDVPRRICIHTLSQNQNIYTIAFSPLGRYFSTGGNCSPMNIYTTFEGNKVASYDTPGIYEAIWNPNGSCIALCGNDRTVVLYPTYLIPEYNDSMIKENKML